MIFWGIDRYDLLAIILGFLFFYIADKVFDISEPSIIFLGIFVIAIFVSFLEKISFLD